MISHEKKKVDWGVEKIPKYRQNFGECHVDFTYIFFNYVEPYFGPKIVAMLSKFVAVDRSAYLYRPTDQLMTLFH